jgi:group I intron endonuclease
MGYIGQSKDIYTRWLTHTRPYSWNNSKNKEYYKLLYQAFRKFGLDKFEFSVCEEVSEDELNEREDFWINYFQTLTPKGYNKLTSCEQPHIPINQQGENNGNSKLTEEDVRYIRECYRDNRSKKEVWTEVQQWNKIQFRGFEKVWDGQTWKNIMPEVLTPEIKAERKAHTNAKYTKEQIREMFKLHSEGITGRNIAKQFGCSESMVSMIFSGKVYKNYV